VPEISRFLGELDQDWQRARNHEPLEQIEPLD
jgi:hypothetical protein